MVATLFDDGILLPTSFEILASDVIDGYVLPIVCITLKKRSCHIRATDFMNILTIVSKPLKLAILLIYFD
jgi:hypothetical protein